MYDRHEGHAQIFGGGGIGRGPGGKAAKSGYDGTRRKSGAGNALKIFNPAQSGKYGSGRSKRPDEVHKLWLPNHKTDGPGTSAKRDSSSPSNSKSVAERTSRQQKQPRSFPDHPQHGSWTKAVARGPNRKVVGA